MRSLAKRVEAEELLERTDLSQKELERSLSDLETANRWLGGIKAIEPFLMPLVHECSSFLDLGCGGGDMLRMLSREGKRIGKDLRLAGIDNSPAIVAIAKKRCVNHPDIQILQADATSLPFETNSFDVVLSSTMLHHLDPAEAVVLLQEATRVARRRVVIADLVRSHIARIGVKLVGSIVFGRLSRYDGAISFMRAYRPAEVEEIARQAGLDCSVYRRRLYRMVLVCDLGGK